MEKVQPQRTELYTYLYTYMEELFQDSCRAVQTILDTDSRKIWKNFQAAVRECLEKPESFSSRSKKESCTIWHSVRCSMRPFWTGWNCG